MVAPSKSFTVIADASIDPDSPLSTGLMTEFRDNDIHLEEWLGASFTAAQDHNHDGANSASVAGNVLATGGGTTYTLTGAPSSTSSRLLVDIWAFVTTDQTGTGTPDIGWAVGASLSVDLSVVEFDGVGRILAVDQTNVQLPTGVVANHNPTALPDNTFTNVVVLTLVDNAQLQIRFNQTTEVFDIRFNSTVGVIETSGIGMRVVEFA